MRQPILWDMHGNKCGSCQLLGHCIVSYEIYYLLNCIVAPGLCLPCVEVRIFPLTNKNATSLFGTSNYSFLKFTSMPHLKNAYYG